MAQNEKGAEVQTILSEMRMQGQWPLKRIFHLITQLTEYDLVVEKKLKTLIGLMVACFVGAFIFVFIAAFLESGIVALVIPVLIILGIVFVVSYFKYKKQDLRNEFREFLSPLLDKMKDDVKPEAEVNLDLLLNSVEDKQYFQNKSDKYKKGVYYKCIDHFYDRDFFTLVMPLSDGNRLTILGHEFLCKTVKTKRNPRGKIKTKTKYKKKVSFDVRLRVNHQKFGIKELPEDMGGALKQKITVKTGARGKVLRMQFTTKLEGDSVPDWQVTLRQIVMLYSYLEPLQAAA